MMGCGNAKVLPEASKKGYVSVVQSLVAFSKAHDDESEKSGEKQRGPWFSSGFKNLRPTSSGQRQTPGDGRLPGKIAKYKDKFDPRVTAR